MELASPSNKHQSGVGAVLKEGIVLPEEHPEDPMLHKVFFGDQGANPNGELSGGVWAYNALSPFTRFRDANNTPVSYGSFTPIIPYTPVLVLMSNNGLGMPVIFALAHTNASIPDSNNKSQLNVVSKSVRGSMISINDKTGNIHLMHNKGESSIVLADDLISLDINDGSQSGKIQNSSFTMGRGNFSWKMKNAKMSFNESGFFIGFDKESSSYIKITEDGIELYGNKYIKNSATESISHKTADFRAEGTNDMNIFGRHTKIGGSQLMNLHANQMEIRGLYTITMKANHISQTALITHRTITPFRYSGIAGIDHYNVIVHSELAGAHAKVVKGPFAVTAAPIMFTPTVPVGGGAAAAIPAVAAGQAAIMAAQAASMVLGLINVTDNKVIATANTLLFNTLMAAGNPMPALKMSKSYANTKDTSNKNSPSSLAATTFGKVSDAMNGVATVSTLFRRLAGATGSATTPYGANVSSSIVTSKSASGSSKIGAATVGPTSTLNLNKSTRVPRISKLRKER